MQSDPRVPEEGSGEGLQDPTDDPDRVGEVVPDPWHRGPALSRLDPLRLSGAAIELERRQRASWLQLWPPGVATPVLAFSSSGSRFGQKSSIFVQIAEGRPSVKRAFSVPSRQPMTRHPVSLMPDACAF